jgi:hypothetical protein
MMEGSIPLTDGSGSRRPKNIQIRRIRIWIRIFTDPDPQCWFLVVPINACRDPEHRAAEEGEPGVGAAAPGGGADPGPPPRL